MSNYVLRGLASKQNRRIKDGITKRGVRNVHQRTLKNKVLKYICFVILRQAGELKLVGNA